MTTESQPGTGVNVRGTELSARDTRERYREKIARITLDSMVQFVGLLDAKGTVLEINKVALDAVGITLADVEGKPFWETFWWQVSEEVNATLREQIARASRGEFVRWDTPIYGRAGGKETIIIDGSLMPVADERGEVVFIAAEGRDITEKKAYEREIARQREELAQLDKLKTQFFANISHEFRTPLTLMMGPLEDALAAPADLSPENRERLELAHRNALRQLKLVNTLLEFSRIEAGRIEASFEPTDISTLTAELASVFRSAIERAGLTLVVDCPPLPQPAYVDRAMWEKLVLNLLSNAFKFTFDGGIEVSLRVVGQAVRLMVRDTGTGIPADELPRLFERFHRVKNARGRSFEGSGIGLAFVKELARLHGGEVSVESAVGSGSTFLVTVPLGSAHLPAERIEAPRQETPTGAGPEAFVQEALRWLPVEAAVATHVSDAHAGELLDGGSGVSADPSSDDGLAGSHVLVADDNRDMRDYIRRLLTGYDVVAVADGGAALQSARARRPDLVLTDVMMPGVDGLEVRTRLDNLSTEAMPVVMGYHPIFELPDGNRNDWTVSVDAKTHWIEIPQRLPTGETQPIENFFNADRQSIQLKNYALIDDVFSDLVRDADGRATMTVKYNGKELQTILGPKYRTVLLWSTPLGGGGGGGRGGGGRGGGTGAPAPAPAPAGPFPVDPAQGVRTAPPAVIPAANAPAVAAGTPPGAAAPAPPSRGFIAFEPMVAITNALNLAHKGTYKDLQSIPPGGSWEESFWVRTKGY